MTGVGGSRHDFESDDSIHLIGFTWLRLVSFHGRCGLVRPVRTAKATCIQ